MNFDRLLMTLFIAFITVVAWGVWLVPAQRVQPRNELTEVFYVTVQTGFPHPA